MWTTSYDATTSASPKAVWAALTALHSGTRLGPHSDSFEPDGPLAVGTTLTVTPQGQGPMRSAIVEFEPENVYADQTAFGDLTLTFRHRIHPRPGGGCQVSHTLEIAGVSAEQVGPELGPQISADFPVAMTELLAAAEHGDPDGARR